jgi:hypothetical protein
MRKDGVFLWDVEEIKFLITSHTLLTDLGFNYLYTQVVDNVC